MQKTFNREYTSYYIDGYRDPVGSMASFDTPKAMGQFIGYLRQSGGKYLFEAIGNREQAIGNGDGLCFINADGELEGFLVNGVEGNRIIPQKPLSHFQKVKLYRNIDKSFEKILSIKSTLGRRK